MGYNNIQFWFKIILWHVYINDLSRKLGPFSYDSCSPHNILVAMGLLGYHISARAEWWQCICTCVSTNRWLHDMCWHLLVTMHWPAYDSAKWWIYLLDQNWVNYINSNSESIIKSDYSSDYRFWKMWLIPTTALSNAYGSFQNSIGNVSLFSTSISHMSLMLTLL